MADLRGSQNPRRWRQIDQIFDDALDQPATDRAAFLDRRCGRDAELRAAVEKLLLADDEADTFLEQPVVADLADPVSRPPRSDEGLRVGPYRLSRRLGEGGMGVVYQGVRVDDEFQQQVAIKLIEPGCHSPEIRHRLLAERQMLAQLQHPHIARLYDGGNTDDGRPYLVMELIDGLPITTYCDRHRLTVNQRLELFRKVCAAVQYAHRNLVVHRDLKPDNILVLEEGTPKLLDFGIAKLLDPGHSGPELTDGRHRTRADLRLLTPFYASPEQVLGQPVTTASDVYSLGVLLWQLLTGLLPYRLAADAPRHEIEHAICEQPPERPSVAVLRPADDADESTLIDHRQARGCRPGELSRKLRGDLDTILLKALRKPPEHRYVSVEQLSEDLRRHRLQMPVIARPDTLAYRTRKFLRRHRLSVAVVALLLVSAIAFTLALVDQSQQTARERDKAERALSFMVGLFDAAAPVDQPLSVQQILESGAERLHTELADQPEMRITLLDKIVEIYVNLGWYERAAHLAKRLLEERRQLYGGSHAEVARSLTFVAELTKITGDLQQSERLYEQALNMQRQLLGPDDPAIASTLQDLALALQEKGDYPRAVQLQEQALAMRRAEFGDDHQDLGWTWAFVSSAREKAGDLDGAEQALRQALPRIDAKYGPRHRWAAQIRNNFGHLLNLAGRHAEAETWLRQALEIQQVLFEDEHPDLGYSWKNLGTARFGQGDLEGAEQAYRRGLEILRAGLGPENPTVAKVTIDLASLRAAAGAADDAERLYHQALAIFDGASLTDHPKAAEARAGLGRLLVDRGQAAEAEPLLRQALDIYAQKLPEDDPRVAAAERTLREASLQPPIR